MPCCHLTTWPSSNGGHEVPQMLAAEDYKGAQPPYQADKRPEGALSARMNRYSDKFIQALPKVRPGKLLEGSGESASLPVPDTSQCSLMEGSGFWNAMEQFDWMPFKLFWGVCDSHSCHK